MTDEILYKKNKSSAIATMIAIVRKIPFDNSFEVIIIVLAKIKKTRQ